MIQQNIAAEKNYLFKDNQRCVYYKSISSCILLNFTGSNTFGGGVAFYTKPIIHNTKVFICGFHKNKTQKKRRNTLYAQLFMKSLSLRDL